MRGSDDTRLRDARAPLTARDRTRQRPDRPRAHPGGRPLVLPVRDSLGRRSPLRPGGRAVRHRRRRRELHLRRPRSGGKPVRRPAERGRGTPRPGHAHLGRSTDLGRNAAAPRRERADCGTLAHESPGRQRGPRRRRDPRPRPPQSVPVHDSPRARSTGRRGLDRRRRRSDLGGDQPHSRTGRTPVELRLAVLRGWTRRLQHAARGLRRCKPPDLSGPLQRHHPEPAQAVLLCVQPRRPGHPRRAMRDRRRIDHRTRVLREWHVSGGVPRRALLRGFHAQVPVGDAARRPGRCAESRKSPRHRLGLAQRFRRPPGRARGRPLLR